jgi:hypothetical protein
VLLTAWINTFRLQQLDPIALNKSVADALAGRSIFFCRDHIVYLLHHVGAARCDVLHDCQQGCAAGSLFEGIPKVSPVSTPDEQKKCMIYHRGFLKNFMLL